jgi:hypothetical protein
MPTRPAVAALANLGRGFPSNPRRLALSPDRFRVYNRLRFPISRLNMPIVGKHRALRASDHQPSVTGTAAPRIFSMAPLPEVFGEI